MFNNRTMPEKSPATGPLPEKEFLLVQELSRNPNSTQRTLSLNLGLSLGMTNLLLRRLARKGLIKVTQLDWKRTQYLLTLKGALEKSRKAYFYTRYTLRIFRQIQENITTILRKEFGSGRRDFWVIAQDEFLGLVKDAARDLELPEVEFRFLPGFAEVPAEADFILTATIETPPRTLQRKTVSLVDFDNINFRIH